MSRLVVEQRVLRCDACRRPFVLRYRLTTEMPCTEAKAMMRSEWVRCGRPACRHAQPVLAPLAAYQLSTTEWLGTDSAVPPGPTWGDVLSTPIRKPHRSADELRPRGESTVGLPSRWKRWVAGVRRVKL